MEINELENKIFFKNKEILDKKIELKNYEIDIDGQEEQFDSMLNESYPDLSIAGLSFDTSYVLYRLDPIAYRCGLIDYIDSLDLEDITEYRELQEELDDLQEELDDLQDELDELN